MNTFESTISTVIIEGKEVPNFSVPQSTDLAVVSLDVIIKLASLLPSASLSEIKNELKDKLHYAHNMEEYINVLQREVDFHKTVNSITMYNVEVQRQQVLSTAQPVRD